MKTSWPALADHQFHSGSCPWHLQQALEQGQAVLGVSPHPVPCSVQITQDGMEALVVLGAGDMRRSLNILQVRFSTWSGLSSLMCNGRCLGSWQHGCSAHPLLAACYGGQALPEAASTVSSLPLTFPTGFWAAAMVHSQGSLH